MDKLRFSPWVLFIVFGLTLALLPIWPDPLGISDKTVSQVPYVTSWIGGVFQATSAALVAMFFVKRVQKLDLSEISDPIARSLAGLGACIVIAAFVVGVCVAV